MPKTDPLTQETAHEWVGLAACLARDGNRRIALHYLCHNAHVADCERERILRAMLFHDHVDTNPSLVAELADVGLDLAALELAHLSCDTSGTTGSGAASGSDTTSVRTAKAAAGATAAKEDDAVSAKRPLSPVARRSIARLKFHVKPSMKTAQAADDAAFAAAVADLKASRADAELNDERETLKANAASEMVHSFWTAKANAVDYGGEVCFYLPLHFKRIMLTILTCPPHILTLKNANPQRRVSCIT